MSADIYETYSKLYREKYTDLDHRETLNLPIVSTSGGSNFIITPQFEYAPDLISYKHYGTEIFDDLLVVANGFTDTIKDFYAGRTIFLPSYDVMVELLGLGV